MADRDAPDNSKNGINGGPVQPQPRVNIGGKAGPAGRGSGRPGGNKGTGSAKGSGARKNPYPRGLA